MKANYPGWINALLLDFDTPSGGEESPNLNALAWEQVGLPPNWITTGPTGKCHYWYSVESICTRGENGPRLAEFARAVWRSMSIRLGADPTYVQLWTKNPASPKWSVTELATRPYRLTTLWEAYGTVSRRDFRKHIVRSGVGRNRDLFQSLREYAYEAFDTYYGDLTGWRELILDAARRISALLTKNHPMGDLGESEIRGQAKSVANWCWDHLEHRGVMGLDRRLPLAERQSMGARYVAEIRRARSAAAIAEARRLNPTATQIEVAQTLRMSERSVRTHWSRTGN